MSPCFHVLTNPRETEGKTQSHNARVLYSGQPVKTIHGELDWVDLSTLIDIISPYVPSDIESLCG